VAMLLDDDTDGGYKLKLVVVYLVEDTRTQKIHRSSLPVHWRPAKKAFISGFIFNKGFIDELRRQIIP
jgi:hypothetical protein